MKQEVTPKTQTHHTRPTRLIDRLDRRTPERQPLAYVEANSSPPLFKTPGRCLDMYIDRLPPDRPPGKYFWIAHLRGQLAGSNIVSKQGAAISKQIRPEDDDYLFPATSCNAVFVVVVNLCARLIS
jgi:hypothetical protein